MRVLIKLGGSLLEDINVRARLAAEVGSLVATGDHVVVVHGGGKQMTKFLAERGVESRFVNGLRVSTPEVIDAVLKVFAGTVNHELVTSLVAAGVRAVGLSGLDASLVVAESIGEEYGAVGRPSRADGALLQYLCAGGYVPTIACVAGDGRGAILNVNGDQMAAACSIGFQADRVFLLTDVDGVKDASGQILPQITTQMIIDLVRDGIATGGMQAKLEAAQGALQQGVREILIAPGALPGVIPMLRSGERIGTRLIAA